MKPFTKASKQFTHEEQGIVLEAAFFVMREYFYEVADHLDVNDEFLGPIATKFLAYMNEEYNK